MWSTQPYLNRLLVFQIRGVTDVHEDLDPFVDPIHNFYPEETVYCEGLVVLKLKAINVMRPCHHCSREGTFRSEVFPGQPQKVTGDSAELLGCGDHVDALIQDLSQFVLGETVLAHGEQDLESHRYLLRVHWYH